MPSPLNKRIAAATAALATLAASHEGLKLTPYYDPPGILTVCAGHTGNVVAGKRYTVQECKTLLHEDAQDAVLAVERCVPGLPDGVLLAFADAVFNMGPTIACDPRKSTAARLLKQGQYKLACEQLPRWNKAPVAGVMVALPGLTRRREEEKQICLAALSA